VVLKISVRGGDEAATLGRLNHPHIVPVHSIGEDPASRLTAVCMPFQGTATLGQVIERAFRGSRVPLRADIIAEAIQSSVPVNDPPDSQPASPAWLLRGTYVDAVLAIAIPLADALAFLHARQIYHRDLKPSNVLLTPEGKPMLLDFNLAQDARSARSLLGGTIWYMSPEQLGAAVQPTRQAWSAVDGRSDLYSLGVILYELLTGQHPFGPIEPGLGLAAAVARLGERHQQGPMPLRQGNPNVDRRLAAVVEQCLTANPEGRFQSADEFGRALRASRTWPQRLRRWRLRHRRLTTAAAILLAAGLGGALGWSAWQPAPVLVNDRVPASLRLLNQGWQAYDHQNYPEAVRLFERSVAADPRSAPARFAVGRAYQKLREFGLAAEAFAAAFALAPDGRIRACQGYCAHHLHQWDEAIHFYREAIRRQYVGAEVYNNLADSLMRRGRRDPQSVVDQAIQLNPRLQSAYYLRALLDLGRANANSGYVPHQGIQDIEKAIAVGPAAAGLHLLAADLHAAAAQANPRDGALDHVLSQAAKAVGLGLDPKRLAFNRRIRTLLASHPSFRELLNRPAPATAAAEPPRQIDPVPENAR
jgi:tetratricopeptide (TPR) repeat protein